MAISVRKSTSSKFLSLELISTCQAVVNVHQPSKTYLKQKHSPHPHPTTYSKPLFYPLNTYPLLASPIHAAWGLSTTPPSFSSYPMDFTSVVQNLVIHLHCHWLSWCSPITPLDLTSAHNISSSIRPSTSWFLKNCFLLDKFQIS